MKRNLMILGGVAVAWYLWKHAKAKQAANPAVTLVPTPTVIPTPSDVRYHIS